MDWVPKWGGGVTVTDARIPEAQKGPRTGSACSVMSGPGLLLWGAQERTTLGQSARPLCPYCQAAQGVKWSPGVLNSPLQSGLLMLTWKKLLP